MTGGRLRWLRWTSLRRKYGHSFLPQIWHDKSSLNLHPPVNYCPYHRCMSYLFRPSTDTQSFQRPNRRSVSARPLVSSPDPTTVPSVDTTAPWVVGPPVHQPRVYVGRMNVLFSVSLLHPYHPWRFSFGTPQISRYSFSIKCPLSSYPY